MAKIHFVGNQTSYNEFFHPVRLFKKALRDRGYEVRYFFDISTKGIENCDTLIFCEDNYRDMLPIRNKDRESVIDYLRTYFARFPRVIWFDSNDGSGWLRSYIFPLVDFYAKSQVLKNLHYYQEQHPTGIWHRDYVIENFKVSDTKTSKGPINAEECQKIRVAWRRAFRNPDQLNRFPITKIISRLLKPRMYPYQFDSTPLLKRQRTIQYRVRTWQNHPPVDWWREQTRIRLVQALKKHPDFQLIDHGSVPFKAYFKELTQNIVTVSPFGLNEFCLRDIWAFVSGSLLFKPNMDHVRSFPDYYQAGETYVSHAWDFSDFEEKLDKILTHPANYEEMAREGQKRFKLAMADAEGFARHFEEMVSP